MRNKGLQEENRFAMPTVYIPAQWRSAGESEQIEVAATNLRGLIDEVLAAAPHLAERFPERRLPAGVAASINGVLANRGLQTPIPTDAEVHFLPAIGAG